TGGAITLSGTPVISVVNNTDSARISSPIMGGSGLTKDGAGTLILDGNSSYSGGTSIAAGTLQIGNGAATGSITGDVGTNGVLAFNRSDDTTFSGNVSGGGSINKLGNNTLTVTGNLNHTGGTTVSAGTLMVGDGSGNGSLTGNVTVNGVVAFNN